jgi:hypothetical protein
MTRPERPGPRMRGVAAFNMRVETMRNVFIGRPWAFG